MKKNDNKGFMLAETLIVASFIAITLIYLFIQFRNVNNNYSKTIKYNNVNGLYIVEQIKKFMNQYNVEEMTIAINYETKGYYDLTLCDSNVFSDVEYCHSLFQLGKVKKAIYMSGEKNVVGEDFSSNFLDYIKSIPTSENTYLIVAEFEDGSFANLKMNGVNLPTIAEKIKEQPIYNNVSSGAGLYYDNTESDNIKYVFKATNEEEINNNIEVFGYKGKIISLDGQGVKVLIEMKKNLMYDNNQSYFTTDSLLSKGSYLTSSVVNSTLYATLNTICDDCNQIILNPIFDVGKIEGVIGSSLKNIISSEQSTQYIAKNTNERFATVNISDIIRGSVSAYCDHSNISNQCLNNNWLANDVWTMNYKTSNEVWAITNGQFINVSVGSSNFKNAYRIVYINSMLPAMGDGSSKLPYKV